MSIKFSCDFCSFETPNPNGIWTTNIVHQTIGRDGKEVKSGGALLSGVSHPDLCPSCHAKLLKWVQEDVAVFIRDNFPLIKKEDVIN